MDLDLSPRGRAALGLLIAEAFLADAQIGAEDLALAREAVASAWGWVEGSRVDPAALCDYIDGETNIPIRSTGYEKGSRGRDSMVATFHSVGIVALYACEEAGERPTESVENFGENELSLLYNRIGKLESGEQATLARYEKYLLTRSRLDAGKPFGSPIIRADILAAGG
jgi:hypothetical protein